MNNTKRLYFKSSTLKNKKPSQEKHTVQISKTFVWISPFCFVCMIKVRFIYTDFPLEPGLLSYSPVTEDALELPPVKNDKVRSLDSIYSVNV